ncbi:hypothetical protein C1637_23400 [Chryseobacterium lactis]|uniref:Yip1 domain-containing protein n=1 Tax=Chryseobacterium lactis TaxID=1241981 RepID=A0A3G6REB4_CHRLC|nr:YIP1 family protein [Chryseobacterium lactis]AZA82783.1 hypothetical protein EG342_13265 [Chryseobacterium lactis]AZB03165.1 hypothetical protein EG341_04130 [Chryseobacterium lactis]PNW11234.1 hypothetical protein C1637_23400 [Chryseobacterium lactis]
MNWKTIFNPFEKFDEKLLLFIGLLTIPLSIGIGYWTESSFSSIYKISSLEETSLQTVAVLTLISFTSAIVVLFILGKIFNNKTRLIDIINTVLISQLILIFLQPIGKLAFINEAKERMISYQNHSGGSFPFLDTAITMAMAMFFIVILIYSIIIYYNGFKTATNIKKWQHIVLFAFVSLITTLVCQILTTQLI